MAFALAWRPKAAARSWPGVVPKGASVFLPELALALPDLFRRPGHRKPRQDASSQPPSTFAPTPGISACSAQRAAFCNARPGSAGLPGSSPRNAARRHRISTNGRYRYRVHRQQESRECGVAQSRAPTVEGAGPRDHAGCGKARRRLCHDRPSGNDRAAMACAAAGFDRRAQAPENAVPG